jgi:hypothetical protein
VLEGSARIWHYRERALRAATGSAVRKVALQLRRNEMERDKKQTLRLSFPAQEAFRVAIARQSSEMRSEICTSLAADKNSDCSSIEQ